MRRHPRWLRRAQRSQGADASPALSAMFQERRARSPGLLPVQWATVGWFQPHQPAGSGNWAGASAPRAADRGQCFAAGEQAAAHCWTWFLRSVGTCSPLPGFSPSWDPHLSWFPPGCPSQATMPAPLQKHTSLHGWLLLSLMPHSGAKLEKNMAWSQVWVQVPALPITSCVTLGTSLYLSMSSFSSSKTS